MNNNQDILQNFVFYDYCYRNRGDWEQIGLNSLREIVRIFLNLKILLILTVLQEYNTATKITSVQ